MQRVTGWIWVAVAGAILLLVALGSDFYVVEGENRDAWLGVPHTSGLILLAAVVAVILAILIAIDRSPLTGRKAGLAIGIVALLATLQVGYRMIAPPFGGVPGASNTISLTGSCLFYCAPSDAADAELLTGIWIALAGGVLVTVGGFGHALSRRARESAANPWVASEQPGMSPWLGIAGLAAAATFILGYTFFTFYTTMAEDGGQVTWTGWLPTPQTSNLVLVMAVVVVGLVWAASRNRSPLGPAALGGVIAALGFVAGARILFRILEPPFGSGAEVEIAAYLSLASAVIVIIAGIVQSNSTGRETASGAVGHPAEGSAS